MIRLEPRPEPSRAMVYLSPLLAMALMLVVGMIVFTLLGQPPLKAFHAFFVEPINDWYGFGELLIKASPLALIALGLAVGFRANIWNIGAEGQLTMGALAAGGMALWLQDSTGVWILLPLMFIAGALGGMLWASIPALLRTRFNTSEILVSLMLVYVAGFILSWLIHGSWRDPDGYGFPQSKMFESNALLLILIEGTRVHAGVLITVVALMLAGVFFRWSLTAFQMRVAGLAPKAALYAGFKQKKTVWIGLLVGGGCCRFSGYGGGGRANRAAINAHFARVWVCGDYCGVCGALASSWYFARKFIDGAAVFRWRVSTNAIRIARCGEWRLSRYATVFLISDGCADSI